MNAKAIKECLRTVLHPAPAWVFGEEFNLTPGYSALIGVDGSGRIDALAVHCWPSEGHEIVGYEVKISRGDFLSEIKNPDKRRLAVKMCDEFYFAVPKGMVKLGEIPEDCGLVECWKNKGERFAEVKLTRWKPKTRMEKLARSVFEVPRWFMAAIMRNFDPEIINALSLAEIYHLKNKLKYRLGKHQSRKWTAKEAYKKSFCV